jgi:hypothetical protein
MTDSCPLCGTRKARRACPALGRQICAVCCGTKRLVEIACPSDCSYLAASRAHPPAVVQRRRERDLGFLLPRVADLTEPQLALLVLFQQIVLKHPASTLPRLQDDDVAEAATAVAATLETAARGIIYQHQAASAPAQQLAAAFEAGLRELASKAGSHQSALERDARVALRSLVRAAAEAAQALPGDVPPVYLRLLERTLTRSAASDAPVEPGGPGAPRLVIPG